MFNSKPINKNNLRTLKQREREKKKSRILIATFVSFYYPTFFFLEIKVKSLILLYMYVLEYRNTINTMKNQSIKLKVSVKMCNRLYIHKNK